jgi:lipopolysaccharide heptosyltransferase II
MSPAWQQARKILCVRLDSLGDVLMCTPAMRALRESLPGSTLTLLGSPSGVAAAPFIPELQGAIVYQAPWMKGSRPHHCRDDAALIALLATRRFDAAVIFTTYTQSALPAALLCQLAGIPLRLAHCRENPYQLLSDWVEDPEPKMMVRHEVQRQLDLVKRVGCRTRELGLSFTPRGADLAAAQAILARAGIAPGRHWLLLHPGASAASRRYPTALWAQAIRQLAQATGLPMVLTGSSAEADLVDEIRDASGLVLPSLAGQLDLGQLGALMRLATVVVANNSGPAHVAAAVGTPVVDLYALTNPQHTPWKVRNRVLFQNVPCRFCFKSTCPEGHHACLAGVRPERVVDAVRSLLPNGEANPTVVPAEAETHAERNPVSSA